MKQWSEGKRGESEGQREEGNAELLSFAVEQLMCLPLYKKKMWQHLAPRKFWV